MLFRTVDPVVSYIEHYGDTTAGTIFKYLLSQVLQDLASMNTAAEDSKM